MRPKRDPQAVLDFAPSNLKITNAYYAKYEKVSNILDSTPGILDLVHRDLKTALKKEDRTRDRTCRYTSENVLRVLICQVNEGLSLRDTVVRIDDSHFLRRFVRLEGKPMMDYSLLCSLKNAIRPTSWKKINRRLAERAVEDELISGEKLRLDTTAVETNIHWPTDSSLLWDVSRVLGRCIEEAREIDLGAVGDRRLHLRRVKRLYLKIHRVASRKGELGGLKSLYSDLLERVEGIADWAGAIGKELERGIRKKRYPSFDATVASQLVERIDEIRQLGERVLEQTRRRVLEDTQVPNDEKLFSIFEEHTELLKRGKAGKPIEFGHMIQIQQVEKKFITDYGVFEKKPVEHTLLEPAIESHVSLFDGYPQQLAADRGYYGGNFALEELRKNIKRVSIGKKGRLTRADLEHERESSFRLGQKFRAGIEGTISFLKRILGLTRILDKGWNHFESAIGCRVFVHNLLVLARC